VVDATQFFCPYEVVKYLLDKLKFMAIAVHFLSWYNPFSFAAMQRQSRTDEFL
jgi:hypothetical protein